MTLLKRDPTEENALKRIAYEAGILAIPAHKRALTSAEKYEFLDLLFKQLAELGLEQRVIAAALHGATGAFETL